MRIRSGRPLSSFYCIARQGDRCSVTLLNPAGHDAGSWLVDVYTLPGIPYREDLDIRIRYYFDRWLQIAAGLEALDMIEERREPIDLVQAERMPDGNALISLRDLRHTALDDGGQEVYVYELRQYTDIWRDSLLADLQADFPAAWARAGMLDDRRVALEDAQREDPAKAMMTQQMEALDAIAGIYEMLMEV